jgi:hypothetical protein
LTIPFDMITSIWTQRGPKAPHPGSEDLDLAGQRSAMLRSTELWGSPGGVKRLERFGRQELAQQIAQDTSLGCREGAQ